MKANVLIVEDQSSLRDIIRGVLDRDGHISWETGKVSEALSILNEVPINLVLLDLELEDGHGFSVLDFIRRQNNLIPVIIISTFSQPDLKLESFRKGTDDYMVKPFHPDELSLRITRSLDLYMKQDPDPGKSLQSRIPIANGELDVLSGVLSGTGKVITLRKKILDILLLFLQNKNTVISKEAIFKEVWGDIEYDENTVQVHLHQLRKILLDVTGENLLETIRGVGYQFLG